MNPERRKKLVRGNAVVTGSKALLVRENKQKAKEGAVVVV